MNVCRSWAGNSLLVGQLTATKFGHLQSLLVGEWGAKNSANRISVLCISLCGHVGVIKGFVLYGTVSRDGESFVKMDRSRPGWHICSFE